MQPKLANCLHCNIQPRQTKENGLTKLTCSICGQMIGMGSKRRIYLTWNTLNAPKINNSIKK
jgi:transcription elongation factor Elf1